MKAIGRYSTSLMCSCALCTSHSYCVYCSLISMQTHIPVETMRKDISKMKEDLKQKMMVCSVSMQWNSLLWAFIKDSPVDYTPRKWCQFTRGVKKSQKRALTFLMEIYQVSHLREHSYITILTIGYFIVSGTQIYSWYQDRGSMGESKTRQCNTWKWSKRCVFKDFAPRHLQQVQTTTSTMFCKMM